MNSALVNSAMAAAVAALRSGDYDTAIAEATAALGLMGGVARSRLGTSSGGSEIEYTPEQIKEFIASARRSQTTASFAAVGGIQTTKIVRERPDTSWD